MEDWGAVQERLLGLAESAEHDGDPQSAADIRVMLERVEELEEMGRAWHESDEHKHANQLRDRVEELERALEAQREGGE